MPFQLNVYSQLVFHKRLYANYWYIHVLVDLCVLQCTSFKFIKLFPTKTCLDKTYFGGTLSKKAILHI